MELLVKKEYPLYKPTKDQQFLTAFENKNYAIFEGILDVFMIDRVNHKIHCTEKGYKGVVKQTTPEFWNTKLMKQFKFEIN